MKITTYKDLNIWKRSVDLVKIIYEITQLFPKEELFGLTSQIRRSAISVPSNIAEGFARFYNKEYRQYLYIALGSCAELDTQITISSSLNYIDNDNARKLSEEIEIICKMITNLIKKINNSEKL